MAELRDKDDETLGDIHHQCSEIQQQVINCLSNQRLGREWTLRMRHSAERLNTLLNRLTSS